MKKILLVVHQTSSDPGCVGQMLRTKGYELDICCPSNHEPLPATMDNHDAVVIFGGPMSANDSDLPFIRQELDWIPIALASDKPFLGICLGAQLLARVLGAKVSPHPDGITEIGYFPIVPTASAAPYFEHPLYVYHWHREGFELPSGATSLAVGEIFVNQAYRYGKAAFGVQFHPEATGTIVERWTTLAAKMLTLPGAQPREEQVCKHALYGAAKDLWLQNFLNLWLGDPVVTSN